ncbi:hypothetical protein LAZ40_05440 [Cereibacter sphaeroides]|uniref:hypothetical protein n=1 Tax=Cereibacter sphaeroides TaxID=1063 RepID=UPI001F2E19DD|nr:hypothetical protein [Cereibacter sphaeroides]MCE6958492.1 hypothetical protein [Cereibacter sphaeroides]MCE6972846.1 hypothetical protein [Cereibacter sphaeroides]
MSRPSDAALPQRDAGTPAEERLPDASARDWPGGDYMGTCRNCRQRFHGPKREPHCRICHHELHHATRPAAVIHFGTHDGRNAGLPLDALPLGLPVLERRFFAGTRRLCGLVTAELSPDQILRLRAAVEAAGICAWISPGENALRAWKDGMVTLHPDSAPTSDRPLRAMHEAPRDGTPVLLRFAEGLEGVRADLERWNGLVFVGRNRKDQGGPDDWGFAAPVGQGGFPDSWLEGWAPLEEGIPARVF